MKRRLTALDHMKLGLDENMRQLAKAADPERIGRGKAIAKLAMPRILEAMEERRSNMEKTSAELDKDRKVLERQLIAAVEELAAEEVAVGQRRPRWPKRWPR